MIASFPVVPRLLGSGRALVLTALVLGAAGCDCGGTRTAQASTGVTLVDPAGPPDQFDRTIDFGTVRVAALQTHPIVLRNDGRVSAHVTKATLTTTSGDLYLSIPGPLPLLEAKETFTMQLRWLPSAIGEVSGTVVVETDSSDTPKYTIHVKGKAASSHIDVCSTDASGAEICASTASGGHLTIDVGETAPGSTLSKPLVIKDLGDAPLKVTKVSPTSTTSSEFTTLPKANVNAAADGSFQVASQKTATYELDYAPVDGGDDDGFIEIDSDDPDVPRLLVEVKAVGDAPRLCVNPVPVEFGDQSVGQTAHQTLELSSCGKKPVSVDQLILVNPDAAPGVFAMANAPSGAVTLQPGDKLDLDLTYTPAAFEADAGQLTIRYTDVEANIGRVPLLGRGVGCSLVAVPSSVSFGNVSTGGRTSKAVTIRSTGTGQCVLNSVAALGLPFAVDHAPVLPATLPPGQSATFTVSFAPTALGQQTSTLALDTSGGPLNVPLSGKGIAPPPCDLQADPASLVFSNVSAGQTATQPVLFKNFGTSDCDIVSGGILPGSSPAFSASVSGFPPTTVPAGGSTSVPVKFSPTTTGTQTGTLEIMYQDSNSGGVPCLPGLPCSGTKVDVSLSGGTLPPQICIDPTTLDFGQVAAGNTKQMSFTITSCGQGALGIRGITLAAGSATDFKITSIPALPAFLAPAQTANVTVTFGPHTSGARFGQVTVLNDDPANPTGPVKLVGNASNVCDDELSCSTDKLSFPTMEVGRETSLSLVCLNSGTQPVTVTGVSFPRGTSGDFSASAGHVPVTVPPGQSIRLQVTYTPSSAGAVSGEVDVQSSSCEPVAIALAAAGKSPNYPRCSPPHEFTPVEKWSWNGSGSVQSSSNNVEGSPLVANLTDDNGDGRIDENDVPDVVFATCSAQTCGVLNAIGGVASGSGFANMDMAGYGLLRAVSGKDGHDLWTVTDPKLNVTAETQIAIADLDGDNVPEVIAVKHSFQPGSGNNGMDGKYVTGTLLVFDNAGHLKFETENWTGDEHDEEFGSAPTVADLDGDGVPEIMFERTVFNSDGTRRFDVANSGDSACVTIAGSQTCEGHGGFPTIMDIDGDGKPDILYGQYAYNQDGSLKWTAKGENGGLEMVLDVDGDGKAEVVDRDEPGEVRILDGATGADKYGPFQFEVSQYACSAAMSAADVDGDGKPELIIPAGDNLHVIDPINGHVLWSAPISDGDENQCGASGSAAFDFSGYGKYDVVYHDTSHMYVFEGTDGTTLFDAPRSSDTLFETPVVADVDNDGHADMIMTNEAGLGGSLAGLKVWSNTGNDWPATRRIWNEHAYHQSNVNENATVPRLETPSWKSNNNWRAQPPLCR